MNLIKYVVIDWILEIKSKEHLVAIYLQFIRWLIDKIDKIDVF